MPNRREVLKMLSAAPLGLGLGKYSESSIKNAVTDKSDDNIFRSIGIEPVINCRGTFTIIGGSIERPEVREAMDAASQNFVQYDELAEGIGRRLAELTGAEWGIVSAGCAAAMKHATAACVTGGNPEKLIRIPDLRGFEKTEVIIPRHSRNPYDHAVRNIGVKVITVETPEELQEALNPRTAMIYMMAERSGPLSLKAIARVAKPSGVPILVDAAAEDLTIPNVHLADGATMVCYSGGKALRGPQCAGLLLGPKNLMMSAWQASSPHHGPGRDNKVGREEMMGMLAAVEAWVNMDHEEEWQRWLSYLNHISERVSEIEGVSTVIREPERLSNHSPSLQIFWDPGKFHVTGEELAALFGRTKPRIAIGGGNGPEPGTTSLSITSWMMQPGNDEIVADRIYDALTQTYTPKSVEMDTPDGNIGGRWNIKMEFFSSESEHTFFIERQDGNWIEGSHKGDFTVRDLAGTIEGKQVKLLSSDRLPGDRIINVFIGSLSNDGNSMSGEVYLGEYLTAKFTGSRYNYSDRRIPVRVPDGPPLAT